MNVHSAITDLMCSSTESSADGPIKGIWTEDVKIPTKKRQPPPPEQNGTSHANGKHDLNGSASKSVPAKRAHPEDDDGHMTKKAKTVTADDEVIILDDNTGGAIVIDDD